MGDAPSAKAILIYSGFHTEIGKSRDRNDDALHQLQVPLGYAVVMADPMGRHRERAASLTVSTITRQLEKEEGDPEEALRRAFAAANQALREEAATAGEAMGSTALVALFSGGHLYVAHVGDARLYLMRGASLYSLTRDHSLMQEIADLKGPVAAGEFAPNLRYIMSRSIGAEPEVNVAVRPAIPLRAGDIVLLCTDGLTGAVADDRIRRTLAGATPREAARRLVELAGELGAEDNTTAVVLRVDSEHPPTERAMSFDDLLSMYVRTPEGDLHPIVDVIMNPSTWAVSAIRIDLRNVERGATCEIPISEIGPLSPTEQVLSIPRCTEALVDQARSRASH